MTTGWDADLIVDCHVECDQTEAPETLTNLHYVVLPGLLLSYPQVLVLSCLRVFRRHEDMIESETFEWPGQVLAAGVESALQEVLVTIGRDDSIQRTLRRQQRGALQPEATLTESTSPPSVPAVQNPQPKLREWGSVC